MMGDECILRKLVADGDGLGDDRRFANMLSLILKSIKDPESAASMQARISTMLTGAETSMRRQVLLAAMNEKQILDYVQLKEDIDKQILEANEKMQEAKKELAVAKGIRKNKEQYELIAKLIQEIPSRQETNLKLEAVKRDLENLHEKQRKLEAKLAERRNNLHAFNMILANFSKFLEEEERAQGADNSDPKERMENLTERKKDS